MWASALRDARPAPWLGALSPPLVAAAIAVLVFRGTLPYFFSQDDFAALARAAGILPRFVEPWRWLSLQAFFDLMRPLAGLDPWPYHAVGLALHAAAAASLAALLARALSPPAALVGAVFFAAHPAAFTAIYWISTVGELGALLVALAALAVGQHSGGSRWWAAPLYLVALLFKESVLLLPACIGAVSIWRARPSRAAWRDPLVGATTLVGLAYLVCFLRVNDLGLDRAVPGGAPYAVGLGRHVLQNALTYLGWTLNAFLPTVRSWSDAVDPSVYPWGIAALALWAGGCLWEPLRRRGWLAAGACYALLLLPVLPLANHTYHYYLYAPLAAAAWCAAALFDALAGAAHVPRRPPATGHRGTSHAAGTRGGRLAWGAAVVAALVLAANGAALVRKIENAPFLHPELRSEPVVDRARIARTVVEGLRRADLPPGTTLVFWSPEARAAIPAGADSGAAETYWERNVRSALYDGLAVRLFFPQVRAVRFEVAPPSGVDSARVAVYRVTGALEVHPAAWLDSLRLREESPGPRP